MLSMVSLRPWRTNASIPVASTASTGTDVSN
jgi:hypothetical protein